MAKGKISIVIDKDGNVTIENHETMGPDCAGVADKLATAVGVQARQDLKAEYYQIPLPDYAEVGTDG